MKDYTCGGTTSPSRTPRPKREMTISAYSIRQALRAPRTYLRRRLEDVPGPGRLMLETHSYSPHLRRFMRAVGANPGLVVDFGVDASSIVVEVGAYLGDWTERSLAARRAHLRLRTESCRAAPDAESFRRSANVVILDYGLGLRDEDAVLSRNGPGSSLTRLSPYDSVTVPIRDIAVAFGDLGLEHIDVLHMNIEGGEYDALEHLAEKGWFPRIGVFVVQFHEWIPKAHRRRRALQRQLRRTHTKLWDYPWVFEAWQFSAG